MYLWTPLYLDLSSVEICKALKATDSKQSSGPDNLDPYRLKLGADFITEPIAQSFRWVFRQIPFLICGKQPMFFLYWRAGPVRIEMIIASDFRISGKFSIKTKQKFLPDIVGIHTFVGESTDKVSSYKCLGVWLDDRLTFKVHVAHLMKKLKVRMGVYYHKRACFNWAVRRTHVQATFLSALDCEAIIYMHASSSILRCIDCIDFVKFKETATLGYFYLQGKGENSLLICVIFYYRWAAVMILALDGSRWLLYKVKRFNLKGLLG